jgi:cysteine desulfurase
MIYLDYAATTPADPRVVEKMVAYLGVGTCFANPASRSHMLGWQAEAAVEAARKTIAKVLHCDVRELVWTSGATESNNLAIKGALEYLRDKGDSRRHIVTSKTEHKAVLDVFEYLTQHGYRATFIEPDENGLISVKRLGDAIETDTALVSIMHVNNETGVINPIADLAKLAKSRGALFHADCAQSAGKLLIDLNNLKADMISLCAHKVYGPKGVGALFVRRSSDFGVREQIHGGGHERGMRSGTLPAHQIVGFAEALSLCAEDMHAEQERVAGYRTRFLQMLGDTRYRVNGDPDNSVSGIVNLSFPGVDGQMLLTALPNLAVSSGSACNSASMKPSHVLKAMGLDDDEALSSLRFSFGRFTSDDEVLDAASQLRNALSKLAE